MCFIPRSGFLFSTRTLPRPSFQSARGMCLMSIPRLAWPCFDDFPVSCLEQLIAVFRDQTPHWLSAFL